MHCLLMTHLIHGELQTQVPLCTSPDIDYLDEKMKEAREYIVKHRGFDTEYVSGYYNRLIKCVEDRLNEEILLSITCINDDIIDTINDVLLPMCEEV